MPFAIRHLADSGVVLVVSWGPLSVDDVRTADTQARARAAENGAARYLYDDRRAEIQFSFLDYFNLQESWEKVGFTPTDRVAIVLPENPRLRSEYEFFETICLNRGLTVKMFESREDAQRFLTGP